MEELGRGGMGERSLFVLYVSNPDDIPATFAVSGPYFVCLLAWDATGVRAADVGAVAERLIKAGMRVCRMLGAGLRAGARYFR